MNQFFMVMCRLRLGLLENDLAERFDISQSSVSKIFSLWINMMYYDLKEIDIWPSRERIKETMPECFKTYQSTRVIIDATEIQMEKPSAPDMQSVTFSNYKSRNTVKVLIGITPSGAVSFVSDLFTGKQHFTNCKCNVNLFAYNYMYVIGIAS